MMLAALFATLIATSEPAICDRLPTLGPADAPIVVRWYVDPLGPGMLDVWLELRRLVGDLEGEVAVAPIFVSNATHRTPTENKTRLWATAAACRGQSEEALRLLAREGSARIGRRLDDREGRAALAREIGLREPPQEASLRALLDAGDREFRLRAANSSGRVGRAPAFAIGDAAPFEDGAHLEAVRREIEGARLRERPTPRSVAHHSRSGVAERLRRPSADAGILVGGVALPHRLVVLVEQADHPDLLILRPALELRSVAPGRLAIQVIAHGQSRAASQLRTRLCAARILGRELDYLRLLTREPLAEASAAELLGALDAAAEAHACEAEEDALSREVAVLPSGLWLDGAAIGAREMAALEREILLIEATASPLDAVFSAAAPPEP